MLCFVIQVSCSNWGAFYERDMRVNLQRNLILGTNVETYHGHLVQYYHNPTHVMADLAQFTHNFNHLGDMTLGMNTRPLETPELHIQHWNASTKTREWETQALDATSVPVIVFKTMISMIATLRMNTVVLNSANVRQCYAWTFRFGYDYSLHRSELRLTSSHEIHYWYDQVNGSLK